MTKSSWRLTHGNCYYRMLRNYKGQPGGRSLWPRFRSVVKLLRLDGIEPEIFIGEVYYHAIWSPRETHIQQV